MRKLIASLSLGIALPVHARALDEIVVVAATPVPGMNVDADTVPGNVQTIKAADLRANNTASVIDGLNSRLGSININDTLADPFQPDILYRGFEASPVVGTPQGLAVYQNGVRINEALGDTVNWDLFPDIAVDRIDIVSASPVFGLNALGGAMSVTMKNGFTFEGLGGNASAGSFNQRQVSAEYGINDGLVAVYAAGRVLNQDGWRVFAHDFIHQYYLDLSFRPQGAAVDVSYTRADNRLFGQGAAPVQTLALNSTNVFTGPQNSANRLNFITLDAAADLGRSFAVQSVLYVRNFRQTVSNGDDSDYTACSGAAAGLLCQGDGTTLLSNAAGGNIPDITAGGTAIIGQNDFERIRSAGFGASLQFTSTASLAGADNEFALGATFDTAQTNFYSGTEVGLLDTALTVQSGGQFVNTPEGTGFLATPVDLNANNKYYGFYFTDTVNLTSLLAITTGARYNIAKIDLTDQLGTALTGNNRFTHLNPALGATYKIIPAVTLYAGYSTNNRAPTASEIECSDPLEPCLLPSNLAGDPPYLRQVIAHTAEAGARGRWSTPSGKGHFAWNASLFRTNLQDDIYGISTSVSTGFFQNIGSTRRQGFEGGLNYHSDRWTAYLQYSYVDATFRSPLVLDSPSNPFHDAAGDIHVRPGDRLPLIPLARLKAGMDYSLLRGWSAGASLLLATGSYYRGDESNQNRELPGYHVVNLRSLYQLTPQVGLFANVQNVLDEHYSTLGLLGDPTGVGAPGIPADAESNDPRVDNRFQSPAMPRAFFAGIKVSF